MEKGVQIFVVSMSVFLIMLFLVGIGPAITGNVVKNSADVTLADFPYPFLKNQVYDSILVIPDAPSAVENNAAGWVSLTLQESRSFPPPVVALSKVSGSVMHRIVVADCSITQLPACARVGNDEGLLVLQQSDSGLTLFVTGNGNGVAKAATVLHLANLYPLSGQNVLVQGAGDYSLTLTSF